MKPATFLKRALGLALSGALLLSMAACGKAGSSTGTSSGAASGSNTSATGRYIETDITPPGAENEFLSLFQKSDGSLVSYNRTLTRMWTSTDMGNSWTEQPGPATQHEELANVANFTLNPNGTLVVATQKPDSGTLDALYTLSPEGVLAPFTVAELTEALASGASYFLGTLANAGDGKIFLEYMEYGGAAPADTEEGSEDASEGSKEGSFSFGGASVNGVYDIASGKQVINLSNQMGGKNFVHEDTLYSVGFDGKLSARTLADGAQKNIPATTFPMGGKFSFVMGFTMLDDYLYSANTDGIQRMKLGETTPETLLSGSNSSLGDPNSLVSSFFPAADNSLLLSLDGTQSSSLYRYSYTTEPESANTQNLNIWSLKDNATIRTAIAQFRKTNPDVKVNYEVALGNSGKNANDALLDLNTRLLAGNGPDIIILDGVQAQNYIDKNMLANLEDILDTSKLFPSIANSYKTGSGTFALPARAKLPLLLGGNPEKPMSLQELVEAVQKGNDVKALNFTSDNPFGEIPESERPVLDFSNWNELNELLWNTSNGSIIQGSKLNTEALREYLTALKAISDKYKLAEKPADEPSGAISIGGSNGSAVLSGSAMNYGMGRALYGGMTADSLVMLYDMFTRPEASTTPFPGLTDGAWIPATLTGLNADSQVKEIAADFIKNLFSPEVQNVQTNDGLPVRPDSLQNQLEQIEKSFKELPAEYQNYSTFDFNSLFTNISTPSQGDAILAEKINPIALSYCKNEISLDEAVNKIEQDTKNYLAEMS